MSKFFKLKVEGAKELEQMLDALPGKFEQNLYLGFNKYVRKHLVPRMKQRLAQATQPTSKSTPGVDGKPGGGGGYGVPKNSDKYAEWKSSRKNLPLVGSLSTRELVATGHLIESINVTHFEKSKGSFSFQVGATPGARPSADPMSDDGTGGADVSKKIDNSQLMEWIEDSKYAFLAKEFQDVINDVVPVAMRILKMTIHQLSKEYFSKVKKHG